MCLLLASMLPVAPNTEKFVSAAVDNTSGVHVVDRTGEGSYTRSAPMQWRKKLRNRRTSAANGIHSESYILLIFREKYQLDL